VYSLSRFEVTPATVVAFLTILGYSLYDTIVVFDKVDENTKGLSASGRMTYADTVNLSMNQVLMRSLNTSLVAILPILSVLVIGAFVLGATTLKDFGLALLIGLLTGAYSSIFVASPVLALLKEREPRYAAIRERLSKGGAPGPPPAPRREAAVGAGEAEPVGAGVPTRTRAAPAPRPGNRPPPRPRKKGKRR
jgi:preprotein translocase subunit SecF